MPPFNAQYCFSVVSSLIKLEGKIQTNIHTIMAIRKHHTLKEKKGKRTSTYFHDLEELASFCALPFSPDWAFTTVRKKKCFATN